MKPSHILASVLAVALCLSAMVLSASPASAQDRYGSIVFSQEDDGGYAWGMAWSYDSRSSAKNKALDECQSRGGSSCSEISWFRNACGALAVGDDNGYGAGEGTTAHDAEYLALKGCREHNFNCSLVITKCAQ